MNRALGYTFSMLVLLFLVTPAAAVLVDHGPNGEYFHDSETGLYWFDPMILKSSARVIPDYFATYAPNWDWASSAQIDALLGQTSEGGINLDQVLGERFSTAGGPRWMGFHSLASSPDGWLAQSSNGPDYDEITDTGSQGGAQGADPPAGAWVLSTVDPVGEPRLWDAGASWELFLDAGTGFYWQDPANFVGYTRPDVQGWLDANSDWRWATLAEVFALQGVHTHGDRPIEEIMGAPQAGSIRWIGFYDQSSEPNGLLLQSSYDLGNTLIIIAGTQRGVETWNPGAWILTETNPTAVEPADWGAVKSIYY